MNERLTTANNSKLNVISKVDASINNKSFQIKTSFLVKGIHHVVILGIPFLNLITHYIVDYDGIIFKARNTKTFFFQFQETPKTRSLNTIKACSIYNNEINVLIQ